MEELAQTATELDAEARGVQIGAHGSKLEVWELRNQIM